MKFKTQEMKSSDYPNLTKYFKGRMFNPLTFGGASSVIDIYDRRHSTEIVLCTKTGNIITIKFNKESQENKVKKTEAQQIAFDLGTENKIYFTAIISNDEDEVFNIVTEALMTEYGPIYAPDGFQCMVRKDVVRYKDLKYLIKDQIYNSIDETEFCYTDAEIYIVNQQKTDDFVSSLVAMITLIKDHLNVFHQFNYFNTEIPSERIDEYIEFRMIFNQLDLHKTVLQKAFYRYVACGYNGQSLLMPVKDFNRPMRHIWYPY